MSAFRFEPLGSQHDRGAFSCGSPPLDDYLKTRARQDAKRLVAAVFMMVPDDAPSVMAGYYTLAATSVALENVPEEFARKLPRYPFTPAILLGRVPRYIRLVGTGRLLLADALKRAYRQTGEISAAAVIVDAKDVRARASYESFGFRPLLGSAAPPSADDWDAGRVTHQMISRSSSAPARLWRKSCPPLRSIGSAREGRGFAPLHRLRACRSAFASITSFPE